MALPADILLGPLLRDVSRSFYLTLRALPGQIRPQIGLAYLLARATDTIADTELVPIAHRLAALHALRGRILGSRVEAVDFGDLASRQGEPAERLLLERCEDAIAILASLGARDRELLRAVLDTITGGQELDLTRFGPAGAQNVIALPNEQDLDDYTYRVAGCVGEFWTRMCREHLFPTASIDDGLLLKNGVRFGKGLQLVNILRDVAGDLRTGRCYLPASQLANVGLNPDDLLDPAREATLRPIYDSWLGTAEAHLRAGWHYTNMLPRSQMRVRLACAWPVLIGLETISLLRSRPVLNPREKVKITRQRVRRIVARSILLYPFSGPWSRQAESRP